MSVLPRARFFGPAPPSYFELNASLFKKAVSASAVRPAPSDSTELALAARADSLDRIVKILALPEADRTEMARLSPASQAAMQELKNRGFLTALRGDRTTDLARPCPREAVDWISEHAPELKQLVSQVESGLAGTPLFLRALKLDRARVSSTSPSDDWSRPNLHFDAEKSSLEDNAEPIYQFYLNAGREPRQFRILPVTRGQQAAAVSGAEGIDPADLDRIPLDALLERYLAITRLHADDFEVIPVPSGHIALFDGRVFAHDAGKGDMKALLAGRFEPSPEPDFVLALDTVETGHHVGLYRPDVPFLEDLGDT